MDVAGRVERMYHPRQTVSSLPQNNFSCVAFRKEKDYEYPGSSRLES
jgi:hypothetical protein